MDLKIGDFARLASVSLKTLHHYDNLGLFRPARVDRWTGYRFYRLDQLPRLNRILVLRDLGFSLDQVALLLDDALMPDTLRAMLQRRQAQLAEEVRASQARLRQVEGRLRWIEQEGNMPTPDVRIKDVPPLRVVGAREVVAAPEQMRERCMALNAAAWRLIQHAGLQTDGVSFALYYEINAVGAIDVEMAYAVTAAPDDLALDGATVHTLPAVRIASVLYQGSYDDFAAVGQLHAELYHWLERNGYHDTRPLREWYLQPPPSPDDPTGVMELQYPIRLASDGNSA